jgi:anti-sigma regulatory factor (Ser/Thr protein kinase)
MNDRGRRARSRAPERAVIAATLSGTAESAGVARALVTRACREWDLPGIELDAKVIVSELVENAVRHGDGPGTVRLALEGECLTVSVTDHAAALPRLTLPAADQPGGRGLVLVDRLSEQWGYRRTGGGKVVWARLQI